jgi:hypothetical protein
VTSPFARLLAFEPQPQSRSARLPWRADGRIFRVPDGTAERYAGVSMFRLADRFARGEDISWVPRVHPRANVARVWAYVENPPWDPAWESPPPDVVVDFVKTMAAIGLRVELTLLTSDFERRYALAIALAERLAAENPPNLLVEIGNEPLTNKSIDVARVIPVLQGSRLLWSSGIYEREDRVAGRYLTHHSARTGDWPRRTHDALEFWTGDGPETTHAPIRIPCVLDEPTRPDEAPGDRAQKIRDFRAYGGGAALFGAGATFHSNSGKNASPPDRSDVWPITDEELACAQAFFEGLHAFPPDAPLGAYRRIVEPGQSNEARTYVVGPYMVRSQQNGTSAPEPGWTAIDNDGVLWRR